jgi:hypothetical protein
MERDLDQARISIDMLNMLQEKTDGNLLDEEKRILDRIVYQLQMNYVDELNKEKNGGKTKQPPEKKTAAKAQENAEKPDSSGAESGKDENLKDEGEKAESPRNNSGDSR